MEVGTLNSYSNYTSKSVADKGVSNSVNRIESETEIGRTTKLLSKDKRVNSTKSKADYINEIANLVPSAKCCIGSTFASTQSGKTLTINPLLLEKMKNDPEKENEVKELLKGVESAMNRLDSVMNAKGWSVVFKNDYIDENGKYHQICLVRNDFMLNMSDKLREERQKNSEKLIEKTKERAIEKKKELEESLENERSKSDDKTYVQNKDKVDQILELKKSTSEDGKVYLDDKDINAIIEAATEEEVNKQPTERKAHVGSNIDLQI